MKLIQIKDYLLLIDEEAEIKEGTKWVYDNETPSITPLLGNTNIVKEGISKGWFNKIIAYYPLIKEAKELDLPLLPNPFEDNNEMGDGVFSEQLWEDYRKPLNRSMSHLEREAFIAGYKAAQSKQFSLDDIKKAIEMAKTLVEGKQEFEIENILGSSDGTYGISEKYTEEKIIQSLSTQQLPKEFIPDIRKIDKYSYKDNYGKQCFTFKGLLKGDIIVSHKNQEGIGGDFIPFPMTLIKESKEYIIEEVSSFGFYTVPWIIDEDGSHTIPDFDSFSVKSKENFKTITNSEGKEVVQGEWIY